jgi:ABC-type amino acid transport substrate-binding protein
MKRLPIILLGLLLAAGAHAGEPAGALALIKRAGVIRLGYLDSAPPFAFDRGGTPSGYSVDLCAHVARDIGRQLDAPLTVEWVKLTLQNRLAAVREGRVHVECGTTTWTLSRQEQVDFSLMTFADGGGLLTTQAANLRGLGDLTGKRIAIVPGTTTEKALADFLKSEFITVQMVQVKDHAEGLAALEAGRADAYASDRGILIGLALTSGDPKRFGLANFAFSYEPYGLMLRRNDAAFRLVVNRALADLYRSGRIGSVYDRWFGAFGKPSQAIQMMYRLNAIPE